MSLRYIARLHDHRDIISNKFIDSNASMALGIVLLMLRVCATAISTADPESVMLKMSQMSQMRTLVRSMMTRTTDSASLVVAGLCLIA
jgi:hypothetical protein